MFIAVNERLYTDGSSLWSDRSKSVKVELLQLFQLDVDFGELRVYFDDEDWNVFNDGLIYTDLKFLADLKTLLESLGISIKATTDWTEFSYSEQGMQGDDYVSFDVGGKFIEQFKKLAI